MGPRRAVPTGPRSVGGGGAGQSRSGQGDRAELSPPARGLWGGGSVRSEQNRAEQGRTGGPRRAVPIGPRSGGEVRSDQVSSHIRTAGQDTGTGQGKIHGKVVGTVRYGKAGQFKPRQAKPGQSAGVPMFRDSRTSMVCRCSK